MRAVVTDPEAHPRLALRDAPEPQPTANQSVVRVRAFSLNAGETRTALRATQRYVPGWDFAGVVERAAADGRGPAEGTRVFGFVMLGAWAERIAASTELIAPIPDGVTDAEAAAIPVAGLTALVCLERAGAVLGRRVLVTGAAGGVGRFACQLAALSGADVFAISRRPGLAAQLERDGVRAVIYPSIADAKAAGTYDVILDSVGGDTLGTALTTVAPGGICVNCGNSAEQLTTFNARDLYFNASLRFHSVWLGRDVGAQGPALLGRLAHLVQQRRVHVPIDAQLPWTEIAAAAARIVDQNVDGKLVLTIA